MYAEELSTNLNTVEYAMLPVPIPHRMPKAVELGLVCSWGREIGPHCRIMLGTFLGKHEVWCYHEDCCIEACNTVQFHRVVLPRNSPKTLLPFYITARCHICKNGEWWETLTWRTDRKTEGCHLRLVVGRLGGVWGLARDPAPWWALVLAT
jgi:hypothetical protein